MTKAKNRKDITGNSTERCDIDLFRWRRICYLLPLIRSVFYPLFKISMIALSSHLIQETLRVSLDPEFYDRIYEEIYGGMGRDSTITAIYLMEGLTFYQAFGVVCAFVTVLALVLAIENGLRHQYICYLEVKRMQTILYDKFMLEPNSVDNSEAMDLVYEKMNSLVKFWSESKYQMTGDMASAACSLVLIFLMAWDLGLLVTVGTIIITLGSKLTWKNMSTPWNHQREEKYSASQSRLMDLVKCKEVVLSNSMEKYERSSLFRAIYSDGVEIRHLFVAKTISDLLGFITFYLIMPLLFVYVKEADLTMERIFQLLLVLVVQDEMVRAGLSYLKHVPVLEEYKRAKESFARVLGVDEADLFPPDFSFSRPKLSESSLDESKEVGLALGVNSQITLEEVSLGYMRNGTFNCVIGKMDLRLDAGERYAFMGETGAGKSTLFKAVAGLIPVHKGHIAVDGVKVDTTSQSWRKNLGVVNQDTVLLNRTVRENLTYSSDPVNDEAVYAALEKVNMKSVIMALPKGLDTLVEFNGNEFSGGQRQRLQIARLLLKDCPLVLLDEMTSALDPETTEDVLDALTLFLNGKTVIMVTHDSQTLRLATQIVRMQKNRPVEVQKISSNLNETALNLGRRLGRRLGSLARMDVPGMATTERQLSEETLLEDESEISDEVMNSAV